jgi:diguanylate cyclase (GGDEF)-like protein
MDQFRILLRRLGISGTIFMLTILAIAISMLITFLIHAVTRAKPPDVLAISIAIIAPLVIVPLFSSFALHLLFQLDQAEEILRLLSIQDDLTGATNRRHFINLAENEIKRRNRYGGIFSIAFIDIDDFKSINDTFGHPAGDQTLRSMSDVCTKNIRTTDTFARYGGDEFVILMPNTDREQAIECVERIRNIISTTSVPYLQNEIHFTVSMGVISINNPDMDLEGLLSQVDRALYSAKRKGKNRVVTSGF